MLCKGALARYMLGTQPLVAMHSALVVTEIIKPCFHFTFFPHFCIFQTRHLKWWNCYQPVWSDLVLSRTVSDSLRFVLT